MSGRESGRRGSGGGRLEGWRGDWRVGLMGVNGGVEVGAQRGWSWMDGEELQRIVVMWPWRTPKKKNG